MILPPYICISTADFHLLASILIVLFCFFLNITLCLGRIFICFFDSSYWFVAVWLIYVVIRFIMILYSSLKMTLNHSLHLQMLHLQSFVRRIFDHKKIGSSFFPSRHFLDPALNTARTKWIPIPKRSRNGEVHFGQI